MIKLLVFIILSLLVLPFMYWIAKQRGDMKQFGLITAGAVLALLGITLQTLYPFYLVLLLLVCVSFLGAFGFAKYDEKQAVSAFADMPEDLDVKQPMLEKAEPGKLPEIKSVNQQPESATGMASIEPIGKEQGRE
ncbi:hypothetical protein [Planococcus lenghuensis]|uniref:Uncharacterized protein n=1 Tax=Planococcus lenghuensis TaxID=2213202 RepID=A0A1Q2KYK9_9BACL|nr:hypothetical protein [Planococcus lenghuensis]AQQ52887.1 hypothetical protein B0X71_07150 [Planococcus lenghuensis]